MPSNGSGAKFDTDFADQMVSIDVKLGSPIVEGMFHLYIGPENAKGTDDELMMSMNEGQVRVLRARLENILRSYEIGLREYERGLRR